MLSKDIIAAKTIAIMAHKNPDGDAIGCVLAMGHFIRNEFGKDPILVHEGVIPDSLRFLTKGWWMKKSIDVKDTIFDLCILLDTACIENLLDEEGRAVFTNAKRKIKIDHHLDSPENADINIINSKAMATAEIIANIAIQNKWTITPEIAKFLYTGIFYDSGGFTHENTTPDTMRIAASLMESGANQHEIFCNLVEKPRETMMNNAETLARTLFTDDGKIGYTTFSVKKINEKDRPHREGGWIHSQIISAKETEVTAIFKELDNNDGKIYVSIRSKTIPINDFVAGYGGGGHALAAGMTFTGTLAEAVAVIIPKLTSYINKATGNAC